MKAISVVFRIEHTFRLNPSAASIFAGMIADSDPTFKMRWRVMTA